MNRTLPAAPHIENGPETPEEQRPRAWKLKVSALALAGVLMIAGVVALKGGVPGLRKQPPFIAAAQGPTKVQPPTDETVTAANDAGSSLLKDSGKPAAIKVVNSEEQPVDLSAQASLNARALRNGRQSAGSRRRGEACGRRIRGRSIGGDRQHAARAPAGRRSAAADGVAVSRSQARPRQYSLRPDGTPIAAPLPASPDAVVTPTQSAPPTQSAKPAPKANDAAGAAQPSTPKLDLPTKLSGKSSARVVVAKTDTTAPDAGAQTPGEPAQAGSPPSPKRRRRSPKRRPSPIRPERPRRSMRPRPPLRAVGRFSLPRRNRRRRPNPRWTGSTANMEPTSTVRRSACTRPSSMARRSIACGWSDLPKPTQRRFAHA